MPGVLVTSLGVPHMDYISDKIYNNILLKVNVYKKYLTGMLTKPGDFKAYYSLCIGEIESKKAFSHSEFNKWTKDLMDPSADQPLPQRDFIRNYTPGSRDLELAGGGDGDFAYSHVHTPTASQLTSAAASAAVEAASAGASSLAAGVSNFGKYMGDKHTSYMNKNQQSDDQLRARANKYLKFFKHALIGLGETINVDTLYKNLRLLCNKFEFDDQQDILSKFSFPSDYDSGFLYSGIIESDNLNITKQDGGYRKKKRKQRYTKRKNSKRRNTKRKKTYKHKRKTKKSKK